jgi:hypothetical protein
MGLLARTPQICYSFPSKKDPTMIQQLKQQSFHPTNLWGKQIRPSPPAYNPFKRPTPFLAHQF